MLAAIRTLYVHGHVYMARPTPMPTTNAVYQYQSSDECKVELQNQKTVRIHWPTVRGTRTVGGIDENRRDEYTGQTSPKMPVTADGQV